VTVVIILIIAKALSIPFILKVTKRNSEVRFKEKPRDKLIARQGARDKVNARPWTRNKIIVQAGAHDNQV
jgi:hypothetical protein